MPPIPQQPQADYVEFLGSFLAGVNTGLDPLLLPPNQLSFASNISLRGTFAKPRPPVFTHTLHFANTGEQTAFTKGLWQGAGYYKPDSGTEQLISQVSGRLYKFTPRADNSFDVVDITVVGSPNDASAPQCWMWQAEKWMIITNGTTKNPIFYDGATSRRSNYSVPLPFNTTTTGATFKVPILDGATTAVMNVIDASNMVVGDVVTVKNFGQFIVQSIAVNAVTVLNQSAAPIGGTVPNNLAVTWQHLGTELPPGRMGCYGLGRVWLSLIDGRQFIAGDLDGGSSGTQAENYRDAVLNITENTYLSGGGNFFVPGSSGDIQAMIFQALLDQQLGQGPLLVVTPKVTFSCQSPVDRTQWTSVQNPIVTEGMIANGGLSQNSTIAMNGDTIMRAIDGIRSMILARRDFTTWGNTPISFEMIRVLLHDAPNLLPFSSAIFFDNRLMMTVGPTAVDNVGVYHKGLVVLNADPLSSIAGKAASIWEGLWLGPTPFQILAGSFNSEERAFAFCYNSALQTIELKELLSENAATLQQAYFDDSDQRISLVLESPSLFKDPHRGNRKFKQLYNGEVYVDQAVGLVDIIVQYRSDQWPGWVNWHQWSFCSTEKNPTDPTTANYQPGYKPRMGLGQPGVDDCESCNDRPMRLGYSFQFRITINGQCRFLGAKFQCITAPEPDFAEVICCEGIPSVP